MEPKIILTTGEYSYNIFNKKNIYSKVINIGKPEQDKSINYDNQILKLIV